MTNREKVRGDGEQGTKKIGLGPEKLLSPLIYALN